MKTIELNPLDIASPCITAASSLLSMNGRIFLCSDDQRILYELKDQKWLQHKWSEAPVLPQNSKDLKKVKPDFEALLGPVRAEPWLLMVPSGSTGNRTQVLKFDIETGEFTAFDMLSFFQILNLKLGLVNVEGTASDGDDCVFMNRGVQAHLSTLVRVDSWTLDIKTVAKIDFGFMDGIALHGSEICIFQNKIYALAVAEDTSNSYDDGKIVGSCLFEISLIDFQIQKSWKFDRAVKLEGLCRWSSDSHDQWLVVSDPDGQGASEFFSFET